MTSLTLLSMHVIWKGKGNVLPISIILADLEINLDENSGAKQHKLYYMCFKYLPQRSHSYANNWIPLAVGHDKADQGLPRIRVFPKDNLCSHGKRPDFGRCQILQSKTNWKLQESSRLQKNCKDWNQSRRSRNTFWYSVGDAYCIRITNVAYGGLQTKLIMRSWSIITSLTRSWQ